MEYLEVGKLVNTQGINGEVRVLSTTDFEEERFQANKMVYAFGNDGVKTPLQIDRVRRHKGFILLHFKGRDSINDVESLKPSVLKVPKDDTRIAKLKPGEYLYSQIIGLSVVDETGRKIGKIAEIMDLPANDVWVVRRPKKDDLMLPKIPDVIKKVDLEKQQVIVELMEGME